MVVSNAASGMTRRGRAEPERYGQDDHFQHRVLQCINARSRKTHAGAVAANWPARLQSCNVTVAFADSMKVSVPACIRGNSLGDDITALQRGVRAAGRGMGITAIEARGQGEEEERAYARHDAVIGRARGRAGLARFGSHCKRVELTIGAAVATAVVTGWLAGRRWRPLVAAAHRTKRRQNGSALHRLGWRGLRRHCCRTAV